MDSKIQLSPFETELLNNTEWILTKNDIVRKAQHLLAIVQDNMVDYVKSNNRVFPDQVLSVQPKISKGENYLGLPWLMLDYPRYFDKQQIFAIRTMFWWGNFFTITLHLAGGYKKQFSKSIIKHFREIAERDFYFCIHEEQWQHHLGEENYKPLKDFTVEQFEHEMQNRSFLKLAKKFSLSIWNEAPQILPEEFVKITSWLN